MNRLRPHFASQQAQKTQRRLQIAIVAAYRDEIIGLIADDGATLPEVAAAVRAEGEPVLDAGFKAAILKTIGTVKSIRARRIKAVALKGGDPAHRLASASASAPNPTQIETQTSLDDDNDDAFVARRPRR